MKKYFSLCITFVIVSCSVAQPGDWGTKNKKAIKLVQQAMEATRYILKETGQPDYPTAIEYCDQAINKDPEFSAAYEMKAEYCIRSGRLEEAVIALRNAIACPSFRTSTGYTYYELAEIEYATGEYDSALTNFEKFATYKNANPDLLKEMEWMIANCKFAANAVKNPVPFDPKNIGAGVNTFEMEYFPTLTVDEKQLLFTRETGGRDGHRGQEDFFVSTRVQGYWESGKPMPKNINTPFNEGAPTFAPDGKTLIFVGCTVPGKGYGPGRRGYGSCDLFVTEKRGGKWLDPINLPGMVNTKNWETQPSLSSDGKTLYFIRGSMRNQGGRNRRNGDIYVSKLQEDGSFGIAVRLPANINTPNNRKLLLLCVSINPDYERHHPEHLYVPAAEF